VAACPAPGGVQERLNPRPVPCPTGVPESSGCHDRAPVTVDPPVAMVGSGLSAKDMSLIECSVLRGGAHQAPV